MSMNTNIYSPVTTDVEGNTILLRVSGDVIRVDKSSSRTKSRVVPIYITEKLNERQFCEHSRAKYDCTPDVPNIQTNKQQLSNFL